MVLVSKSDISCVFLLPISDHQYIQPYEMKDKIFSNFHVKNKAICSLDIKEALKSIKNKFIESIFDIQTRRITVSEVSE